MLKEIFKKIFRKINKKLTNQNLYFKYFKDNIVWENTVFLESYTGQSFQGNPYYIFKEMLTRSDCVDTQYYIAVIDTDEWKNKLKVRGLLQKNVHVVTYGSVAYVKALCHCKYIINNVVFNTKFIKKDGQIYLNTWHGTGPKSCGNKLVASPKAFIEPQRNFLLADYILCPNEHSKKVYLEDHMLSGICEEKLLYLGYPRNAIFFDKEKQKKTIDKYKLNGKNIVFYLPTWRGKERLDIDLQAINAIDEIAGELIDTHVFYCKLHPNMLKINFSIKNCKTIPEDCELYEILSCADYLITDWSSVYTDFANKSEKIILYQYDRDHMLSGRGLYNVFVESTPFPIARTGNDVKDLIENSFKADNYKEFLNNYCAYDNLHCTKDIVDTLFYNVKNQICQMTNLVYIDRRLSNDEICNLRSILQKYSSFKFILPDNLCDDDYLFYNALDKFDYLIISNNYVAESNTETELHRLWGNLKIDKLLCINIDTTPCVLTQNAKDVIVLKHL